MDVSKHYDKPKMNQENINHLKRSITSTKTKAAIKCPPKKKKSPGPDGFYQTFKEELHVFFHMWNIDLIKIQAIL
jgi:hypothetical protein